MTKFKPGDRVRCVVAGSYDVLGEVYTVGTPKSSAPGYQYFRTVELAASVPTHNFDQDRYELVEHVSSEADPSGLSAHTPGAKLDAGKLRPALVLGGFASALEAVVKVGTDGAAKYTDNGWKDVPNGFARYDDAARRHTTKRDKGETHDADSGSLHLAHEAWNALARLELYLKEKSNG